MPLGEQQTIERPKFTDAQNTQAQFVGYVTDAHRAARSHVKTHPIDDVEPGVPADRDDGIFVEAQPREGGGYRVHITIADVAGHVKLNSHLGRAATARAQTLYHPGGNDPMFPKNLEERMRKDPQFALMNKIAKGIRKNYFGNGEGDTLINDLLPVQAPPTVESKHHHKSMEMVATYMLLTNSCMADFFDRSELPLMYRNFNEPGGDVRASYSPHPKRHTALEKMGLKGAYCHFTSPIRRAPDFLNAHMAHFVHGALKELEAKIIAKYPAIDTQQLHKAVWGNGAEIMRLASSMKNGAAMRSKAELEKLLGGILVTLTGEGEHVLKAEARKLTNVLATFKPPLTAEELQAHADHFNALSGSTEVRSVARSSDRYRKALKDVESLKAIDVAEMDRERFSRILQSAALTGAMPRVLYNETLQRIEEKRYDPVQDGLSILIRSPQHYHRIPRWNMLKRAVASDIKNAPSIVNSILELSHTEIPGLDHLQLVHDTVLGPKGTAKDNHVHTAIIRLHTSDGEIVSSPFYSVGHDARAALSHARFSFLEGFAFGELQSAEDITLPNLLYARLEPGAERQEVVEQMVRSINAEMEVLTTRSASGYITTIHVSGGDLNEPIDITAQASDAEKSRHIAMRRLLREPVFKQTVSQPEDMRHMLNPQHVLKELIEAKGGVLEISKPVAMSKGHGFTTTVKILTEKEYKVFEGHGPNMDRAIRTACAAALTAFDWSVTGPGQLKSWSTREVERRPQRFDNSPQEV